MKGAGLVEHLVFVHVNVHVLVHVHGGAFIGKSEIMTARNAGV